MNDIVELSSDSSEDTIIFPGQESTSRYKLDSVKENVEDIVKKYIHENALQTASEATTKLNMQDTILYDEDLDMPLIKRLKTSNEIIASTSFYGSSSSQDESGNEEDALQMLQEKYRAISSNNPKESKDNLVKENNIQPLSSKEMKKIEKELQKQKKLEEKEQKKKEAAQEKCIKQVLAAANKNIKPTECMKFITALIDSEITTEEYGNAVLTALQMAEVHYKVESKIFPCTITWTRRKESHSLNDDGKLVLTPEEEDTSEVLLIMKCKEFVEHISNTTLCGYIQSLKSVLGNKKIMLAIYGLQSYNRYIKNQKQNEMRTQISDENERQTTNKKFFENFPKVTKKMIESQLTEIQVLCDCSHRMIDSAPDLGLLVTQYTKAVAEIPFKLQRYEKFRQTDWFVAGDNRDCVRVDKNGNGLNRLWNQMFTTFPLARLETAEAISSQYPTVSSLMKAYQACQSTKEAELLLQDIPIRRAAGPLSSSRKIGPELSKKVHNFFTSIDGDSVI